MFVCLLVGWLAGLVALDWVLGILSVPIHVLLLYLTMSFHLFEGGVVVVACCRKLNGEEMASVIL